MWFSSLCCRLRERLEKIEIWDLQTLQRGEEITSHRIIVEFDAEINKIARSLGAYQIDVDTYLPLFSSATLPKRVEGAFVDRSYSSS